MHGENGRYLIAKQDISRGSYGIDNKIRARMTATEMSTVTSNYNDFVPQFIMTMSSTPIEFEMSHDEYLPYSSSALFVGKCIDDGWLNNNMVRELMPDTLSDKYLTETMERVRIHDMFFFEYWRNMYQDYDPNEIWNLFSFVLTYGLLECDTITIGEYISKANCPSSKWNMYIKSQTGGVDDSKLSEISGDFIDITALGVQTHIADNQIPANECVLFLNDIKIGDPVELDYGAHYLLSYASQIRNFRDTVLHPILVHIIKPLDTRVSLSLEKHMAC